MDCLIEAFWRRVWGQVGTFGKKNLLWNLSTPRILESVVFLGKDSILSWTHFSFWTELDISGVIVHCKRVAMRISVAAGELRFTMLRSMHQDPNVIFIVRLCWVFVDYHVLWETESPCFLPSPCVDRCTSIIQHKYTYDCTMTRIWWFPAQTVLFVAPDETIVITYLMKIVKFCFMAALVWFFKLFVQIAICVFFLLWYCVLADLSHFTSLSRKA